MNWVNFENAIQAQVVAATAISPSNNVFWENQSTDRPSTRPFIALNVENDDSDQMPETRTSMNPTPTPGDPSHMPFPTVGDEVILSTQDHAEITIKLTAFTTVAVGDAAARSLLRKVKKHFQKDSVIDILETLTESIAIVDVGNVQDASFVLETKIEGRATMSIRLRINDVGTETTTYIETVVTAESPPISH